MSRHFTRRFGAYPKTHSWGNTIKNDGLFPFKSKNVTLDINIFYFESPNRKCSLLACVPWPWPVLLCVADRRQGLWNWTKLHQRRTHLQFNPTSRIFFYRNQPVKLFQPGLHGCCWLQSACCCYRRSVGLQVKPARRPDAFPDQDRLLPAVQARFVGPSPAGFWPESRQHSAERYQLVELVSPVMWRRAASMRLIPKWRSLVWRRETSQQLSDETLHNEACGPFITLWKCRHVIKSFQKL